MKLTAAQATIKFLDQQYIKIDNKEIKFVEGVLTIFGHGNVLGLGSALNDMEHSLKVMQGKNEQSMAHIATAFSKQNKRQKIMAVTSSIGPGSLNMVTAAATATVNNIPLLLLPSDNFATRFCDPVLQQLENESSLNITNNDCFIPVSKYFDRIDRCEKLYSALIQAFRVLTNPNTGAVTISMPQDVQGESYDFDPSMFKKRIWEVKRKLANDEEIAKIINLINSKNKILIICGGGVKYSNAENELEKFCKNYNIPFAETQAGKGSILARNKYNLGGIGVTGNKAANTYASNCDLIIGIGTRYNDFTTGSNELFKNEDVDFININISNYHAFKYSGLPIEADALTTLKKLNEKYEDHLKKTNDEYKENIEEWKKELNRLRNSDEIEINDNSSLLIEEFKEISKSNLTQTKVLKYINSNIDSESIICGASGSLPGDLQRIWEVKSHNSYHMEYGYSCMGYEIAGALGCKMAEENREVYAMTGDGSFLMLHSELLTAIQLNKKINILLFDNSGFGCINNLQKSMGNPSFQTEFRNEKNELMLVDYQKIAEGYGLKSYLVTNMEELEYAINDSKKQKKSVLIDIKILPKTMTSGYESWWHVGVSEIAHNELQENKKNEFLKIKKSIKRR